MISNTYFLGMCLTMLVYIVVGMLISKKIKTANDYYVAGRNAPAYLITGSLVASYTGTGTFMGDVGECYSGYFAPIMVVVGILSVGYTIGSVVFGRYLRRSNAITIAEYFGKRFNSKAVMYLATITGTFIMLVYMTSCVQGIGTLMAAVTGVEYSICIILSVITFTLIAMLSGSKGVLITDTIMFAVFSAAAFIGTIFIVRETGGWTNTVTEMASYEAVPGILAWTGNLEYSYPTGKENMIWAFGYGIAWMSVLMVAPWQSSRYLMAKNEHAVIRSGIVASVAVFLIEFLMCISGVFVQKINPGMEQPSEALIWASMNIMPQILGIVVLSGILAAGISSVTTFLSLIGSNIANDVFCITGEKKRIFAGRIAIVITATIEMILCIANPPAIFWIIYLGATIVACSWMPVAIASVWSKRVTKTGAFCGMLAGFIVSAVMKIYLSVKGVTLPIYFDPFFVGIISNLIALIAGSAFTEVTPEEKRQRELLFLIPEEELDGREIKKTKRYLKLSVGLGGVVTAVLIILWVLPYMRGLE